ncbi:META domain-containing protein [Psychrobacter aquaticus]|uniref:META domain-containing protein n=1 Tax=Psychrobacter aquaticus TaxID=248452 RepID=UPI0004172F4C|nr:META domain-containing protein [Psychrobacter aquaticus]
MMLNSLRIPLVIISALLPVALLGCQTNSLNHLAQTSTVIDDKNWSADTPIPRLLQTLTKYEWQLTHLSNNDGKINPFNHKPPLVMNVRPDALLFQEGCHRYQGNFNAWRPLPYPYSLPDMSDMPDNCDIATNSSGTSNSNKGEVQQALDVVFAPYSNSYFRFDPILPNNPLFSKKASKQMRLTTDKGKVFIFSGRAKPIKQTSGLSITNELLERYDWHLIRATDDTNTLSPKLNNPNVPITASFRLDAHNQGVGFLTGCNGVGGSYALSTNHTLLIGASPSTLMGCGELVNGIENYLDRIMHNSTSQLTLTHPDNNPIADSVNETKPSYLFTQKLDSGERLIWKNEAKKTL